jgi:Rhodopirellula transposase DDE domain
MRCSPPASRWTTKSLRALAGALTRQGHPVNPTTVGRLPHAQGYSLQRTRKTLEGAQHPDRDAQFAYPNDQVKAHLAAGQPAVSVGTDHVDTMACRMWVRLTARDADRIPRPRQPQAERRVQRRGRLRSYTG